MKTVHGLKVASSLDMPELIDAPDLGGLPDLKIQAGQIPNDLEPWDQRDPDNLQIFIKVPGVLSMLVENGKSITYAPEKGVPEDEIRLFLLGSGLGALLMQRGFLVVHGNAVVPKGRYDALLCVGESGAGKSTTAIAMLQRGHQILADDVAPIDAHGFVHPGMARAKLWQKTADKLGIDTTRLARIRAQDDKFNLPLGAAHATTPTRLSAIFCLSPDPNHKGKPKVEEVTGVAKFVTLRNNLYRPEQLRIMRLEAGLLGRLTALADQTPVYRVSRSLDGFEIDALLDALLDTNEATRHG
ncbi:MAG: hypothetical protein AAGD04_14015 [Pseudomonadota bacterium]